MKILHIATATLIGTVITMGGIIYGIEGATAIRTFGLILFGILSHYLLTYLVIRYEKKSTR